MKFQGKIIKTIAEVDAAIRGIVVVGRYLWVAGQSSSTVYLLDRKTGNTIKSFATPGANTGGLFVEKNKIYLVDFGTDLLYLMNENGQVIKSFSITGISGLTTSMVKTGANMFIVAGGAVEPNDLQSARMKNNVFIKRTTGLNIRRGLGFDGYNLWIASVVDSSIKIFNHTFNQIRSVTHAGAGTPQGIGKVGKYSYISDFTDNVLALTY